MHKLTENRRRISVVEERRIANVRGTYLEQGIPLARLFLVQQYMTEQGKYIEKGRRRNLKNKDAKRVER
jgi:hypothetical protein